LRIRRAAASRRWEFDEGRAVRQRSTHLRLDLVNNKYIADVEVVLARRRDNGGDLEALQVLESKLDGRGRVVVERPHRNLAGLSFCAKARPSDLTTARYREVRENLKR